MSRDSQRRFEGRVAVITGAGKGLGRAYALWLAREGCAVIVNNRVRDGLPSSAAAVVREIVNSGGTALAHEEAVEEVDAASRLVELAVASFGKLDILICNAGVMPVQPFAEADPAEFARTVDINLLGTIYPLQAAWKRMVADGYGRVVLSGSDVGVYGYPGAAVYGATRSAVVGLARSLSQERPSGSDIGVNVIMPFAYTGLSAPIIEANMDERLIEAIHPDFVAPAVGWLCSEQCGVSGEIFHIAASKMARVGIVESGPVPVNSQLYDRHAQSPFRLEPLFEPLDATMAVGRLLGFMEGAS